MQQYSITELKPGMIFNAPLYFTEEETDFFLAAKFPFEKKHKVMLVHKGIPFVYTEGEIIRMLEIPIHERPNEIRELLHELDQAKAHYKSQPDIDIYNYLPNIELYSAFKQFQEQMENLLVSLFRPDVRLDRFKKQMDIWIKKLNQFAREHTSFCLDAASHFWLKQNHIEKFFHEIIIGMIVCEKIKLPYQYTHYWAQAKIVQTLVHFPIQGSKIPNEKLSKIITKVEAYGKLDIMIEVSKYYFQYGSFVQRILEYGNQCNPNPRNEHKVRYANLDYFIHALYKWIQATQRNGLLAPLAKMKTLPCVKSNEDAALIWKTLLTMALPK